MANIDEMWKNVLEEEEFCVSLEQEIDRLKNDLCVQEEKLRKAKNNRPTSREVVMAHQIKNLRGCVYEIKKQCNM